MECKVLSADSPWKYGYILVLRVKDRAVAQKRFPVARFDERRHDPVAGSRSIVYVKGLADLRDARIFYAVGFQFPAWRNRRFRIHRKANTIATARKSQV